MFTAGLCSVSVDPWVAPRGSLESDIQLSRRAAERSSVRQALRERRLASRPARSLPRPARVEPVGSPSVDSDAPAHADQLTPVG
ncbi:hypothetical protein GCM10022236_46780 [Microlunatus ginsengisoli]|uniref:Uncharacterized protein n=1 Tax=Microlunatus ginsengisoli TaxID=363863 RepID=A0ABP7ASL4_9ACTN